MFLKTRHIHFVGIGGIGMSGIAEVLCNLGYQVSGSDLRRSPSTSRLEGMGVQVALGHDPSNVEGSHVVVRSSAVREDNPEVIAAREAGIPVIPRAEMLAELMRMKQGVAVAGTHGKTTTTSLLAALFEAGGLDPTIVVGGKLNSVGTNAVLGRGEWMVAEADESDGSFLHLSPILSVVTNIDPEHLEHYGSVAALHEAFVTFINKVPFYGAAVLCLDHPVLQQLLPLVTKRYLTYGFTSQADFQAVDATIREGVARFSVMSGDDFLGPVVLKMPGRHNILNALAAIAIAMEAGIPFPVIQQAMERFEGVQRRFTIRQQHAGVTVIDDYAHHPAEIAATLEAASESYGRRVVAVWQPHRYTRVRDLYAEFMRSFNDCGLLLVLDIYRAGEDPIEGVHSESLVRDLRQHGHKNAFYTSDRSAVLDKLRSRLRKGDVVITLGAGDVTQLSHDIAGVVASMSPPTLEMEAV
ncbi:MAG TPA: UDP-N-acetylmuramate--L-alanine ligase [Deltaproteobacteria bacterium]|nr:UDP-N-acetylmuramate--L-alanine ligase [Deltaproteobacteria bacterium]HCP46781.1 UDP-N-acetylmuramate--L-alanine ligase [Deltaproteobacteria bacterium]